MGHAFVSANKLDAMKQSNNLSNIISSRCSYRKYKYNSMEKLSSPIQSGKYEKKVFFLSQKCFHDFGIKVLVNFLVPISMLLLFLYNSDVTGLQKTWQNQRLLYKYRCPLGQSLIHVLDRIVLTSIMTTCLNNLLLRQEIKCWPEVK